MSRPKGVVIHSAKADSPTPIAPAINRIYAQAIGRRLQEASLTAEQQVAVLDAILAFRAQPRDVTKSG